MVESKYYTNVLIADDTVEEIANLKNYLQEHSINVEYANDPGIADDIIEKKQVDLLILDWFFVLPQSPAFAIEVVRSLIDNKYFIPIFIYCNNDRSQEEINETFPEEYPRILINYLKKPNPSHVEGVVNFIDDWFKNNPGIGFSKKWYNTVQEATGKTLQEMYNRLERGVINLLGQTYKTESNNGAEEIINLMTTVLQEYMLKENSLITHLDNIIKKVSSSASTQQDNYEALRSFEMYSNINTESPIGTGDVFLLDLDILLNNDSCSKCITNKHAPVFAVAISAECDYARSDSNIRFHKFILGKSLYEFCREAECKSAEIMDFVSKLSNHNQESYYYLPFIQAKGEQGKSYNNVVLDFQNVISVNNKTFDSEIKSRRICRLRPLYYQHLIRRYSAFSSRIGVPEIPRQKRNEIAREIAFQIENMEKV